MRAVRLGLAALFITHYAAAAGVTARVNQPHLVGTPIEFAANGAGTGKLTFRWDFGDGQQSQPSSVGTTTHVYAKPGHYPVLVSVEDEASSRTDSFLQTVHRAIPEQLPSSSSTIVHDRTLARVCNVNADNDTVSCLATSDLDLLFEVPVGRNPRTLAFGRDATLWVVNQGDSSVTVLDQEGDTLTTIRLPYASRAFGLVMSPSREKAYVSLQGKGELVEIDVNSREIRRTVRVGPWATGVAVDGAGERIFVTRFISSSDEGEVVEVDASSFSVTRTFSLSMDPGPDSEASARGVPNYLRTVVPSPDGSLLWVPSKKDNVLRGIVRDGEALTFETSVRFIVSFIDPVSNAELLDQRADINNRALGLSLTFSPLGDYAFVALLGNNGIEILDAYNRRIVGGTFELAKAPDGLVLDDLGRLYLNAFLSRTVVVLDVAPVLASTGFSIETIRNVVVSTAEKLAPGALLGKRVFYDASDLRMSRDGYISCASCHLDGFEDGRVWDFTDRGEGLRNTTSLLGRRGMGHGRVHWSANFDEIQDFEHDMRGPFGGSGFLSATDFESGTTNTTLGDKKAGLSKELDALAEYLETLDEVHPSPHRDPDGSLSTSAWRGLELFQQSGCAECHGGADFTDSATGALHDVGTLRTTSGSRLGGPLEGLDTPTLRGVWETAPYLHDGSAPTLLDVLLRNTEDLHGTTRKLNAEQRGDLVRYLQEIDNVALEDETEPAPPTDPDSEETSGSGGCAVMRPSHGSRASFLAFALLGWTWRLRRKADAARG